jgi:hypothetical protein
MEIGEGENGVVTLPVRRPSESLALRPISFGFLVFILIVISLSAWDRCVP